MLRPGSDWQVLFLLPDENLNLNEVVLMVVGNKIDRENDRKVPNDRPLREYKEKFDIDCWEASAKTGYNVREVFAELL
jgi:GTPase SAR1 family protein